MLEKKESQKMQMVHFLDIDTSKITLRKPKANKYNGSQIGILYNRESMYVKYEGVTPFRLKENFDKDGNYQGTTMQINCEGEYLRKARELDHRRPKLTITGAIMCFFLTFMPTFSET